MQNIQIDTKKKKGVVDITGIINDLISKNQYDTGVCSLFTTHTTCALTVSDLDPGTDEDLIEAYEAMVPDLDYRHPHDPSHVGDHIMSALLGPSILIPTQNSSLALGTWQRVVLVEFNGPKQRRVIMNFIKTKNEK